MKPLPVTLPPAEFLVERLVVLLVACLFCVGCSEATDVMGTVTGTVVYDGKPVPSGRVIFQNKETGRATQSEISSEGKYKIQAPVGMARVAVVYEEPPHEVQYGGKEGRMRKEMVPGKSIVPKRYASPRSSPIEFEVTKGTHEFEVNLIK